MHSYRICQFDTYLGLKWCNSISRIDQQSFFLFLLIAYERFDLRYDDFTLIFFLKNSFSSLLPPPFHLSLEKEYFTFFSRVHFKIKFRRSLYRCSRLQESFIRHLRDWIIIVAPKKNLTYDDPHVALIISNVVG